MTGGAWYTDQEFESEFVEILNQQSYNYLYEKLEKSRQAGSNTGPMAARSMSMATSKEVSTNFETEVKVNPGGVCDLSGSLTKNQESWTTNIYK